MNIFKLIILLCGLASTVLANDQDGSAKAKQIEPDTQRGISRAVVVSNSAQLHTAQILPGDDALKTGEFLPQLESVLKNLERVLKQADTSLSQCVKLNLYATSDQDAMEAEHHLPKLLPQDVCPAISLVTTALPKPGARIALDAIATAPDTAANRKVRRFSFAELAVSASEVGKSSAAILPAGSRVYISGQAEAGNGTLKDATVTTMVGLQKTLEHLGLSSRDVVQVKAFLRPMRDAAVAIEAMSATFPESSRPPIVLVEWESASAPIEIELIAASPAMADAPSIEFVTPPWMKPSPVFARVTRLNHSTTIYISGLYGSAADPNGTDEVREVFGELDRIARLAGSDLHHLAKATYYVSTDDVSRNLNTIRPKFYQADRPPAASKAMVAGTGRKGRSLTLDMIAVPR
ncbi:MAG: RidA family protein [Planctomycetaceae bacterium]